jgi:hypothetical protein
MLNETNDEGGDMEQVKTMWTPMQQAVLMAHDQVVKTEKRFKNAEVRYEFLFSKLKAEECTKEFLDLTAISTTIEVQ